MSDRASAYPQCRGLQQCLELLVQHILRSRADELVDQLASLEEEDGRDVAHAEVDGDVIVLLDVALADDDPAVISFCQFLNDRTQHLAGTAPGRPQINYQRQIAVLVSLQILGCDLYFHVCLLFMILFIIVMILLSCLQSKTVPLSFLRQPLLTLRPAGSRPASRQLMWNSIF